MASTDTPQDPVAVALHAGARLDSVGILWVTGGSIVRAWGHWAAELGVADLLGRVISPQP